MKNSIVFKTSFVIVFALIIILSAIGLHIKNSQINIIQELQTNQKTYILEQLNRTENLAIQKEMEILKSFIDIANSALSDALYNGDLEVTEVIVKKFLTKQNIKAIFLFDTNADTIFLTGFKKEGQIYFSDNLSKYFESVKFLKFNLIVEEEIVGYIKVYYDNEKVFQNISKTKENDISNFKQQSLIIKEKVRKELIYQSIGFIIGGFAIVLIIIFLLIRLVNKPLNFFQDGLNSFFDYLEDSSKKVKTIDINTSDEFGQMTKSVNHSISVSMKMHGEIANLMRTMDINVITNEIDDNGIITNVSKAFCDISGYTKEELIGKVNYKIKTPFISENTFNNIWKTLEVGNVWSGELQDRKKDGSLYWVYTIITPKCVKLGASCGYTAIRYDITDKKEVEDLTANLEIKIKERTKDLNIAKKQIEATHKHTRESIEYAALIQGALLPDYNLLDNFFKDNFVHWMPKDTVGGDIWLFNELRDKDECLLLFIDCTGHGVPGAFVTMIVKAIEREIVAKIQKDKDMDVSPAWIMGYFNKTMKILLKQETKDSKSNAGWDGGIIYYNRKTQILKFSGAETPLFYVDTSGDFHTVKGNRYSVGYKKCTMDYQYKETILNVQQGMKFYCTTDGYLDQNGGEKDFPFGKRKFGNIIKEHHTTTMPEQYAIFIDEMAKYESMIENNDRNDDMTVIGFEIDEKSLSPDIILEFDGVLTQNIIGHNIDIIEHSIDNMGIAGKLSTLVIELTQNMMKYSKSHDLNCRDIRPAGFIEVLKTFDDRYIMKSKNIIAIDDKEKIEPKLLEIQSLDEAGIKKRYRELRRSGVNTHNKGGGIGFYEIAKLCTKIEYNFTAINEEKYYFEFECFVQSKKRVLKDNL